MPTDETIQQLGYDVNPNPASLQIGRHGNAVVSIIDNDCKSIAACVLVHLQIDDRYRLNLSHGHFPALLYEAI